MINQYFQIILLVVGFSNFNKAFAQSDLPIAGKVVDVKSGLPLGYATISIKGRGIGTVTNNDGEFEFHISQKHLKDTLVVSMLGYSIYEIIVESIDPGSLFIVSLKESVINLKEVVVVGDTISANGIFAKAYKRLTETFPQEKFLLNGFYRQINTENNRNVLLIEAALEIYDKNYQLNQNLSLREKVVVKQVRSSNSHFKDGTKNYFEQSNTLATLLKFNFTHYKNPYVMGRKNFVLDSVMQLNDRIVYVISSSKKGDDVANCFTFYIDTKTFAFWRIENRNVALPGKFLLNFDVAVKKNRSLVLKLVSATQTYQFEEVGGKMFLSQAVSISKGHVVNSTDNEVVSEVADEDALIINEVQAGEQINIPNKDLMDNAKNLIFFEKDYSPDFWLNYNLARLIPLTKKQISDLEIEMPLEEQFKQKK